MRVQEWTANTFIKSCFMDILVISLSQMPFSSENVDRKRREERTDGSELLYQLHLRFWHLSPTAQNEVRTEIKVRRHLDTWQWCTRLTQQSNSNLISDWKRFWDTRASRDDHRGNTQLTVFGYLALCTVLSAAGGQPRHHPRISIPH